MTKEIAIDILDDNFTVIDTHGHYTDEEVEQARQVAIKALKQEKQELKQESALDKIRAEIERQEKWLMTAGYNAYNVDIALDAIKRVIAESEDKE